MAARVLQPTKTIALMLGMSILLCPVIGRTEQQLVCPTLQSSHVQVAAPAGWTGLYRGKTALPPQGAEAIFVFGSLAEPWGETHPDVVKNRDGSVTNKYRLAPGIATPGEQLWLICHYGEGIHQAMQLPADTRECLVTYRRMPDPFEPKRKRVDVLSDIRCK